MEATGVFVHNRDEIVVVVRTRTAIPIANHAALGPRVPTHHQQSAKSPTQLLGRREREHPQIPLDALLGIRFTDEGTPAKRCILDRLGDGCCIGHHVHVDSRRPK